MPGSSVPHDDSAASRLAAVACAAALVLVALGLRFAPADAGYLRATFTPEHVQLLGMFDNRGQQWVHRALLLALAVPALVFWLRRPVALPATLPAPLIAIAQLCARYGGWLLIAAVILAGLLGGQPRLSDSFGFQGRFPLGPVLSLRTQLLLGVLALVALHFGLTLAQVKPSLARRLGWAAAAAFAAYALVLIVLGLARPPDFTGFSPGLLAGVEWHYSGAVASADRLAEGLRLGEVPIHSAFLASIALGAWQRAQGLLSFGGHIRAIEALQAIAVVVCIAGYGRWYAWRAVPWLAAGLLVLPWIQPLHAAVLYPNQSAWRFLAFLAGVVLLTLVRSVSPRTAALLGMAAGFAVLWNVETGVCLAGAYAVFLVLRTQAGRHGRIARAYAGGIALAFVAFALFVRLAQGAWPDPGATLRSLPLIGSFLGGYGGLAFKRVDVLAVLVFAHALYLLLRGVLRWAEGAALEPREACRTALAALLVAWSSYYFKAPDPWNLWSALFLYGFFIEDLLPAQGAGGALALAKSSVRAVALALIVAPVIVATNAGAAASALFAARQGECPAERSISGICAPAGIEGALRDKAAALAERAKQGRVLYFSANTYLMPMMTGVTLPLRTRDAFSDTTRAAEFEALVAEIGRIAPACVLFDDEASPLSGYDAHRSFYRRLRQAVAPAYQRVGLDRGWDVWCATRS